MDNETTQARPPEYGGAIGSAISVGQIYALRHSRFGRAVVTVTAIPDETWIDVEVVSGTMRGMGAGAVWGPGDSKRVRREHCTFTPNAPADLPAVAGQVRLDVRPRFVVVSDGLECSVHDLEIRRDLFPTLTGNRKDACEGCGLGTAQMIALALNFYEANKELNR